MNCSRQQAVECVEKVVSMKVIRTAPPNMMNLLEHAADKEKVTPALTVTFAQLMLHKTLKA